MQARNDGDVTIRVGFERAARTDATRRPGWIAAGGVLGALAVSSCCILPLVLFSLGITGAWIGNLAALSPYQPYVAALTLGLLGAGFYAVYRKPAACAADRPCDTARPMRITKSALWVSAVLVVAALAFPYYAPLLLDA